MNSDQKQFVIHHETTVADIIAALQQLDPRQRFLTQVILPDGTAWNAPATVGTISNSNCGDGLPYLYMQMRCDNKS
jgi:hypothetical protein